MIRNLIDRWMLTNPIYRFTVYAVAGVVIGIVVRVVF